MSDQRGAQDIQSMLQRALADFFQIIGCGGEFAAGWGIPIYPAFDPAEDVIQKHGIGTGPTTPDASKHGSDHKQEEPQSADREEQDPHVLGHHGETKNMEAPHFHIEEQCGSAIDRDPWHRHINGNHHPGDQVPRRGESPTYIGRMKDVVGTIVIDRRDRIKIGALDLLGVI